MTNKMDGRTHDVFITHWALTSGIIQARAHFEKSTGYWVVDGPWVHLVRLFDTWECFETLEQAQAEVEKQVGKRIKSLKKRIDKLQDFKPKLVDARGKSRRTPK